MAHYIPNEYQDEHHYSPTPDQWDLTCASCFKSISASRPPVFNSENRCCVDLGGPAVDDDHDSVSMTSSSTPGDPAPVPENRYLEVCPKLGLNEARHRRASLSLLSYPMQKFLRDNTDEELKRLYAEQETKYLELKLHIVWLVSRKKSVGASSGGSEKYEGFEGNVWAGMGAWIEDGQQGGGTGDWEQLSLGTSVNGIKEFGAGDA